MKPREPLRQVKAGESSEVPKELAVLGVRQVVVRPRLSVVMPCYNERNTIREIVKLVLDAPFEKELIIVDDGSNDGTREVVQGLADAHANVRAILQPENRGKGAALNRGFTEARHEIVLVQDSDLEYDPNDYASLIAPIVSGRADVVFGSRFSGETHRVLLFWHEVANRALTTLSNMTTNLNLTDMEAGYKVFRREVIQSIVIEEQRFGFEPEITAKVSRIPNIRVYEVPVSYFGRTYAEGKKIGLKDAVRAVYAIGKYGVLQRRRR
jgi:glycosyltransferase involved in cell wall biosynthesis